MKNLDQIKTIFDLGLLISCVNIHREFNNLLEKILKSKKMLTESITDFPKDLNVRYRREINEIHREIYKRDRIFYEKLCRDLLMKIKV
jgi:hypothetical protein